MSWYTESGALTVLRYPGGKSRFVSTLTPLVERKRPTYFVEPFAGGASVSLTLLWRDLIQHAVLIEKDPLVYAFWERAIQDPSFVKQVESFDCTRANVEAVLSDPDKDPGFYALVSNRTSFGGLITKGRMLNKGDGRGISSRWIKSRLVSMLKAIRAMSGRIILEHGDGLNLLQDYNMPEAVIFADPPYSLGKGHGKELYDHWDINHSLLFERMAAHSGPWVMTYDNQPEVQRLARAFNFETRQIKVRTTHHEIKAELLIGRDLSWLDGQGKRVKSEPPSGPKKTHMLRTSATTAAITRAIFAIEDQGETVTISEVARLTGISREHLQRRYRELFRVRIV